MAALRAGGQAAVRSFANTAKELIEQFTFKGFKNASFFCKVMRGLGIGGAYMISIIYGVVTRIL
jgi:hypothetical protein